MGLRDALALSSEGEVWLLRNRGDGDFDEMTDAFGLAGPLGAARMLR